MSNTSLRILVFSALVIWGGSIAAQTTGEQIRVLGIHASGKVLLRWAPSNFAIWKQGNQQGYRLERYTLVDNGNTLSSDQVLASRVVLNAHLIPATESTFLAMSDTSNAAGVAGAALYEDSVKVSVNTSDPFIQALSLNEQNESRFGLGLFAADASFAVAQAMALGYTDTQVAANSVYDYRVAIATAVTPTAPSPWSKSIDTRLTQALPALPVPSVKTNVKNVLLSWSKEGLDMYYTGYDVERSADNGVSWQKRNQHPVLPTEAEGSNAPNQVVYTDTLESTTITYLYRLRGMSIFGISQVGNTSNTKATAAALSESPSITEVSKANTGQLNITWTFPSNLNAQIKGFNVYRSALVDGSFVKIGGLLANTIRQYTDASPSHTNYYKIKAMDLQNNEVESFAMLGQPEDNTPPAKVSGLSGKIDPSGKVTLSWNANTDSDFNGYRIYQGDTPTGDFVQVNGENLKSNTFSTQISLNTTAKFTYFKVRALDFRQNLGEASDVSALALPDIVPPSQPLLVSVEPSGSGAQAKWIPSTSKDVVQYELQHRSLLKATWTTVASFDGNISGDQITLDTTLKDAADWEFRVVATDKAGLSSSSTTVSLVLQNVKRADLSGLKAESSVSNGKPLIKLSWEYPQDPLLKEFAVYRAENGGLVRLYQFLDLATFAPQAQVEQGKNYFVWFDAQSQSGNSYQYQIIAKFLDGSTSMMSGAVNKSL